MNRSQNGKNDMKTKMLIATLLGCLVWQQAALSQNDTNNQPSGNGMFTPVPPPSAAPVATPAASPAEAAPSATNNEPATPPSAMTGADTNEAATAVSSNATAAVAAPAETAAEATNSETASAAAAQASAPQTIPLIQFQDVPLTTAIENLARQAGINYLLDPKIGYGQPDQNGQIKPEPTLSIRWENITAQQALLALLDNYGLQLNEDRQTQIARITVKDPTAPVPLITRVIQLKYASTSNMVDSVSAALTDKRSKVLPDSRTSQIVVVATEKEQEAVDSLVAQLDKPTRQVLIETKLVEISSNPSTKKGIDWSSTLAAQNLYAGNFSTYLIPPTAPTTTTTSGGAVITTPGNPGLASGLVNQSPSILGGSSIPGFFQNPWFLNADGLHAVLSFLNQDAEAQVVSTPRVVTLDNETATISVTRGYPVINVVAGTANTTGGSSITYSNIGTVLQVTPRITANDYIWLKVIPDVSSFFGVNQQTISGTTYTADIFDSRHIETQVLIPNANTLVMGGMVKDNPNSGFTKVPILGDIPFLGYAFRSETKTMDKDNLLIFITPTIVKDADFQPSASTFLQSKPLTMKEPLNVNSAWDSAKPHDWSNPSQTDPTPALIDQNSIQ